MASIPPLLRVMKAMSQSLVGRWSPRARDPNRTAARASGYAARVASAACRMPASVSASAAVGFPEKPAITRR